MKTDWIAGFLGTWSTELTLGAILLRLALSMALAANIGCERSSKRHSAGLRTFILVSLAGTSTMLIDQYLMDVLPITIPVLSAAAVIGITTISGNSILFSSKNQIKGLTTSVGLWCCGIVGLEALSRGAAMAEAVEREYAHAHILMENARMLGLTGEQYRVRHQDGRVHRRDAPGHRRDGRVHRQDAHLGAGHPGRAASCRESAGGCRARQATADPCRCCP